MKKIQLSTGEKEEYEYDGNGNMTRRFDAVGNQTKFTYNKMNRIVVSEHSSGKTEQYEYDALGKITSITDKHDNATYYIYSPLGNIIELIDATGHSTKYAYDKIGRFIAPDSYREVDGEVRRYFSRERDFLDPDWVPGMLKDDVPTSQPASPSPIPDPWAGDPNAALRDGGPQMPSIQGDPQTCIIGWDLENGSGVWGEVREFFGDVWADLQAINFNPLNTDRQAVLDSNYVSFYRGRPVIRHDIREGSAAIFGTIWLNRNADGTWIVGHEWGHTIQESILGTPSYFLVIAIPSLITSSRPDHHKMPWERNADWWTALLIDGLSNQPRVLRPIQCPIIIAQFQYELENMTFPWANPECHFPE